LEIKVWGSARNLLMENRQSINPKALCNTFTRLLTLPSKGGARRYEGEEEKNSTENGDKRDTCGVRGGGRVLGYAIMGGVKWAWLKGTKL